MERNTIILAGRTFENVAALKERLGISEYTVRQMQDKESIVPIKVGLKRYFDRAQVDRALIDG
jgi:DNA-binding transcriptional MerR regulator